MAMEFEKDAGTFGYSDGQRDAWRFVTVRERATEEEDSAAILRSTVALLSHEPNTSTT